MKEERFRDFLFTSSSLLLPLFQLKVKLLLHQREAFMFMCEMSQIGLGKSFHEHIHIHVYSQDLPKNPDAWIFVFSDNQRLGWDYEMWEKGEKIIYMIRG